MLCGMDEVGRGALAGPVSVGAVVIDEHSPHRAAGRARLQATDAPRRASGSCPGCVRWALAYAVGHASAAEIDRIGIMAALQLAGRQGTDHA